MDLTCIRNNEINVTNDDQTMSSWGAFNSLVTDETIPEKIVGFLPVLPFPVTEYSTVYTALKNFQDIESQLTQDKMPVTCDEGVYHIAREIMLQNQKEFSDLVPCLGSFHMTKIFLGCIGKYLQNSGAENIWVENGVFGENVVKSVLGGTHYVRSFKGMNLLAEMIERLQWKLFFANYGVEKYQKDLTILANLKQSIHQKDETSSKSLLHSFEDSSDTLLNDFSSFKDKGKVTNETFKYWNTFLEMVVLLKNLVRADREGNWLLHLTTVQAIIPYFIMFDCINYTRWCTIYLEDMRRLPTTAPAIYERFMQGHFVIKRTPGRFKAVAADMCLEQTINRSHKSSGGIIGSTRQKQYVAQWELIYYEMASVSKLHRELSGSQPYYHELTVNHEFSKSETDAQESDVINMIQYVQQLENPFGDFEKTDIVLHNIITQEVMTPEIRKSLLSIDENGRRKYLEFRKARFIDKSEQLFDTIHRNNVKTFKAIMEVKPNANSSANRKVAKDTANAHRILEIGTTRGCDTEDLFKYDLVSTNSLFDSDGLMNKPAKSNLMHELEKSITEETRIPCDTNDTCYIVDVMANIRKVSTKRLKTFGEFCNAFLSMLSKECSNGHRVDLVFDSYINGSIKDTERIRRSKNVPIEINTVQADTPLPKDMDTFWGSIKNKTKVQDLLRKMVDEDIHKICQPTIEVVLSATCGTYSTQQAISIKLGIHTRCQSLGMPIEEADVRIVPHTKHAAVNGFERVVLLSGDTDVMVLSLHFWEVYKANGLQELWIKAGVSNTTRYISLHTIAELNHELCKVLPAAHALTGSDCTSKVGTKLGAVKATPELYLTQFGVSVNSADVESVISNAEQYLVNVLKPGA